MQEAEDRLSVERLPTIVGEDDHANLYYGKTQSGQTRNGNLTSN
jgi:hypothetical protein